MSRGPKTVFMDGRGHYWIKVEGAPVIISGQEANRLIFHENWGATLEKETPNVPV